MINPIQITFLGTGTSQGIPVIACPCKVCQSKDTKDKRLRCSILIQSQETSIIIDTGPDFRQQLLRENVQKLDAVIFTHQHKDHIAGLDDIRAFNFQNNIEKKMPIFCNLFVKKALEQEFSYIFSEEKYPGVPLVEINVLENKKFNIRDITFLPVIYQHHKMDVWGYRIRDFAYITDIKTINQKEEAKLKNLDILVVGALTKTEHLSHFNLQEAIVFAEKIQAKKTYFTHISHFLGSQKEIDTYLEKNHLKTNISLAFDGLKLII